MQVKLNLFTKFQHTIQILIHSFIDIDTSLEVFHRQFSGLSGRGFHGSKRRKHLQAQRWSL